MRYMRFAVAGLLLAAFALVFANSADAKMQIRAVNNTNEEIFVAVAFGSGKMVTTHGWYGVDAGSDRLLTFNSVELPRNYDPFIGYYAENGPKKGRKTLFWGGEKDGYHEYPVHPTKTFEYRVALDGGDDKVNNYGSDAKFVNFLKVSYKNLGGGNGSATLTFNK